jgi:predicted O-methyltransferase YrrM
MKTLRKGARYFRTYAELLFRRRPSTPEAAVEYCFKRPIRPAQVRGEVTELARLIQAAAPKRSMEIGSMLGGTLFLLCTLSPDDAQIISLDLPAGRFGGGYPWPKIPLFRSFAKRGQQLHLIRADSHLSTTRERVLHILKGERLDFLFIDGDHTYDGVKQDFEMYGPLVRPGGVIAFHDILEHPPELGCEVVTFWRGIKGRYTHREIVENCDQGWAGIGVLVA